MSITAHTDSRFYAAGEELDATDSALVVEIVEGITRRAARGDVQVGDIVDYAGERVRIAAVYDEPADGREPLFQPEWREGSYHASKWGTSHSGGLRSPQPLSTLRATADVAEVPVWFAQHGRLRADCKVTVLVPVTVWRSELTGPDEQH